MRVISGLFGLALLLAVPASADAQSGFGLGGRVANIRADVDGDTDGQRFTGAHLRSWMSPRSALELSIDRRSETSLDGDERVRTYPIQASLLLAIARGAFAPYLLGGAGWYLTRVDTLEDEEAVSTASSREFGWHGGFGAELRFGRHVAAHADYRYTFLSFGDDDEEVEDDGVTRFLPSHKGSMWTAGLTLYF